MDDHSPTPPTLTLWRMVDCDLCTQARDLLHHVLTERAAAGLPRPTLVERDLAEDPSAQRDLFDRIPVLELEGRRLDLAVRIGPIRAFLAETLDEAGPAR